MHDAAGHLQDSVLISQCSSLQVLHGITPHELDILDGDLSGSLFAFLSWADVLTDLQCEVLQKTLVLQLTFEIKVVLPLQSMKTTNTTGMLCKSRLPLGTASVPMCISGRITSGDSIVFEPGSPCILIESMKLSSTARLRCILRTPLEASSNPVEPWLGHSSAPSSNHNGRPLAPSNSQGLLAVNVQANNV